MRREQMREQLLEAAEAVLATDGAAGATVRAITARAGVNVASVTTAFGGRRALLDEVFIRIVEPVNLERTRRYDRLSASAGIVDVVRAFVEPLHLVGDRSVTARTLRALVHDADVVTHPLDRVLTDPGIAEFTDRVRLAVGHLSADRARARVHLAVATIFTTLATRPQDLPWHDSGTEDLVRFLSAGLAAPVDPVEL